MQKKTVFLAFALTGLMGANQVLAQSSHDAITGADADFMDNTSKFEISSPDGNYKLGFGGHFQHDNTFTYINEPGTKDFSTKIRRARLKIYGNAFDPSITYLFQTQFEKANTDGRTVPAPSRQYTAPGSTGLRDYYVNIAANEELFHLRIGKFRTPFSRQQLISTSQMQFNNQNLANNFFELTETGRDVGVMFHNGFNNPFEYALAAVSNGLVLRLGYNHNGIDAYDFADFAGGGFRFAVALNGFLHTNYKSTDFNKDLRAGVDFIVKYEGLAANGAFYFGRANDKNDMGAGLDLGYLINQQIEPVLRYSWVRSNDKNANEIRGGLNYYVFGHHLKVQSYVGPDMDGSKITRWEGGAQLQFAL